MTGSTSSEGLRPQETSPIPTRNTLFSHDSFVEGRDQHHQPRRKMTPLPPSGTPIQLTPLWEHVVRIRYVSVELIHFVAKRNRSVVRKISRMIEQVRTRRFPSEIDTRLIFVEISERLRDPEWEVRQHALRVLMDVMPTLSGEIVDEVMQPVVPELLNNLGHAAPAVRKGALDALRVYLVHSLDRERIVKNIFRDGFNRRDVQDVFQTNLITGVILSAPSLLFPSSSGSRPSKDIVKYVTFSLASRLTQVAYQEAILKSLMKIRETIGAGEFDDIISGCDGELKKHLEVLCKVYNVKPSKKSQTKISSDRKEVNKLDEVGPTREKIWDSDSDTSGIAEEEDEIVNGQMPPARVVLETEIKFNEETAITMTILEEKATNSEEDEEGEESGTDVRNETEITSERNDTRKKTPRRVHFGGEIVKLRTPDSDDTESVVVASSKTRIPLPVSPATKMPLERSRRRSISQPNSPHFARRNTSRMSRSLSSSPKREIYTHNADLSPKKGILTRTSSPLFVIEPIDRQLDDKRDKRNDKSAEMSTRSGSPKLKNDDDSSRSPLRVNSIEENFVIEKLSDDIKKQNDHRKDKEDSKNVKEDKPLFRSFSVPSIRSIESNYESKDSERIKALKEQERKKSFSNNVEELSSINNQANLTLYHESANDTKAFSSIFDTKVNNRAVSIESNHENLDDVERSLDVTSKIDEKIKDNVAVGTTSGLKSNERESTNALRKIHSSKTFKRERDSRSPTKIVDSENIVTSRKYNEPEEIRRTKTSHAVENGNLTRAVGDNKKESKSQEPSWEELGLVNRDVLDDLHNKKRNCYVGIDIAIRIAKECMEDKNRDTEIDDREPLAWSMIHCPQDNIYMITTTLLLKFHLYDLAGIALAQEMSLTGRSTYLLYYMAVQHYLLHRHDDALSHLKEARCQYGMDYSIGCLMGHCYFQEGDFEEAIKCYEFANMLFNRPDNIYLLQLRVGLCYENKKEYEKAKKVFLNACQTSPTSQSWLHVGISFYELNQLKEAEVALIEANKIDNCNVDVWGYLCLLNLSLNRYEEFAQCYRQAIKYNLKNEKLLNAIKESMERLNYEVEILQVT